MPAPVQIIPEGLPLLFVQISSTFWTAVQNSVSTPAVIQIFNSTDGGATWNEIDAGGEPNTSLGWNASPIPAVFDGDHTFTFFYYNNVSATLNLQQFDLNAGTWGAAFGTQDLSPMTPLPVCLQRQSTGNFIAVFQDVSTYPAALYSQVWNGSSWSAAIDCSVNAEGIIDPATMAFQVVAPSVIDPSDVLHLIFWAADAGPPFDLEGVFYQEITASNALQNFQQFPDNAGASPDLNLQVPNVVTGPAPGMLIVGNSIYWAITRIGSPNGTYPSVYVGTPLINPVWTEAGNLDPSAPASDGATCPALFYQLGQFYLVFLAAIGNGPARVVTSLDGFNTSTASVLYDDTSGPKQLLVDAPLLLFGTGTTVYLVTGSAPEEGPAVPAFFSIGAAPAPPPPAPTTGSIKITLRGVKLRCKPSDEPKYGAVPKLASVKRAM